MHTIIGNNKIGPLVSLLHALLSTRHAHWFVLVTCVAYYKRMCSGSRGGEGGRWGEKKKESGNEFRVTLSNNAKILQLQQTIYLYFISLDSRTCQFYLTLESSITRPQASASNTSQACTIGLFRLFVVCSFSAANYPKTCL